MDSAGRRIQQAGRLCSPHELCDVDSVIARARFFVPCHAMPTRRRFLQTTALSALAPAFGAEARKPLIGITVLPEFVQSEGIDGVLRNLIERAGANAVTTSPYVMESADEKTGSREPPIDAGAGSVRLLDRDLFGKRELWVRTAPSFTPNTKLYAGLRYQPPQPDDLTKREGGKVGEFVKQAKAAGLTVYLQVLAASPPGYREQFSGVQDEDQPRRFDGKVPARRVDKNGSLASPHILAYTAAMLTDLARQYPQIDGFRIDWPEYPPYFLDALFVDYSVHAKTAAQRLGYNFDAMRAGAESLHKKLLGQLTNRDLEHALSADASATLLKHRWLSDALKFRTKLVRELVTGARRALDEAGEAHMEIVPNAFPPPWNTVSGFDFSGWSKTIAGVSVKEYAMHWAMMLRFYGDEILAANEGLDERLLVRALVHLLDIADEDGLPHLADYHYPEPNEPHPCGTQALGRKIKQAQLSAGDTPVFALAHGYGPAEDFRRRLTAAHHAGAHGFWVNRYGYLSDEKLSIIREVTRK